MEQRYRLKQIRNNLELSQAQFATKINYPLSTISAIEAGNQKLPMRLAYILQDVVAKDANGDIRIISEECPITDSEIPLRAEWLFRGTGQPFGENLKEISSHKIKLNLMNKSTVEHIEITENIKFFQVNDNSMSPFFNKCDIIAININETEISSGNIYLVKLFDEQVVRTIYKINTDEYNIVAENADLIPQRTVQGNGMQVIGAYSYMIRMKG